MAQVRMTLREADGRLPDVCMVCGEEATVTKAKKMSWCPPWVGILILGPIPIYIIVALLMTKRTTVQAPLCDAHQGHWFNRLMINLGTLFVCTVIGAGGAFAIIALTQGGANDVNGLACFLPIVMFLIWIIVLVILQQTAIRPKEITDREIVLTGVCQEFVNAVEEQEEERLSARRNRRGRDDDDEDEDDDPPPRKKRSLEIKDGPPPPKKKRPPVDDDDEDEPPPRKKKRPPSDDFEE